MQVKALEQWFQQYQSYLSSDRANERLVYWSSSYHFQEQWDIDELAFAEMYDRVLQNNRTRRLWKRENYEPKAIMMTLIKYQKELVRSLFQDLFDENIPIAKRTEQFRYHLDQLLEDYREQHPVSPINDHFHGDYEQVSLYLAFRFPKQYIPYRLTVFQRFLERTNAKNIPPVHDLERYFKVGNTVHKLISRKEDILAAHRRRLARNKFPSPPRVLEWVEEENQLLAFDFIGFVGDWRI